jgi:hypothetical protein
MELNYLQLFLLGFAVGLLWSATPADAGGPTRPSRGYVRAPPLGTAERKVDLDWTLLSRQLQSPTPLPTFSPTLSPSAEPPTPAPSSLPGALPSPETSAAPALATPSALPPRPMDPHDSAYQLSSVGNQTESDEPSRGGPPVAPGKQTDTSPTVATVIAACGVGFVAVGAIVFAFGFAERARPTTPAGVQA